MLRPFLVLCCVPLAVWAQQASLGLPKTVQKLEAPGVQNLFRLSDRIYSGSAPEGDAGFAALARLGVKTIISVDGTKPEVETARRYGLRYVHLPHGYDGIPFPVAQQLAKAAATLPGPIYVHCHHGKHRGPTAAALMCEATEGWSPAQAIEWLQLAGTAPAYDGLYESAKRFRPPSTSELEAVSPRFPEVAEVSLRVDTMVAIDALWDRLKPLESANSVPASGAAHDSILLWEHFRELGRTTQVDQCAPGYAEKLVHAESAADALRTALGMASPNVSAEVKAVGESCAECHKAHRDGAKPLR